MRSGLLLALAGCRGLLGFDDVVPAIDPAVDGPTDGPVDTVDAVDAPDAAPACPTSYTIAGTGSFAGSHYRLSLNQQTWPMAAALCAIDGPHTHLIVLGQDTERGFAGALNANNATWIGLSDRKTEGTFLTVTDEVPAGGYPGTSGNPWAVGEPTLNGPDCAAMDKNTADLITIACDSTKGFICECDGFADNPMNY